MQTLHLVNSNNNKTITKFSEASSFLTKNYIPTSCHPEAIRKLGFDMILDEKVHTTPWSNTSKELPRDIIKIVDEIKKVFAKEIAL